MSYVSLSLAKSHLAVFHSDDDTLIQQCLDAAESYAASFMNRPAIRDDQFSPWLISNIGADSGSSETIDSVPAAVIQAILMLTGDYYANRIAQDTQPLNSNKAVDALLHFHRVGLGI